MGTARVGIVALTHLSVGGNNEYMMDKHGLHTV